MPADFLGRLRQRNAKKFVRHDVWRTELQLVESPSYRVDRIHFDVFAETRFVVKQTTELTPQGVRKRIRKGCEEYARFPIVPCQMRSPVQRDDRLACPRR